MRESSRFAGVGLPLVGIFVLGTCVASTSIFKLQGHLIVVEGQVHDVGGLNFILDTGTSTTVIDSNLAERLRLETQPVEFVVLGSKREATSTTVASLRFSDFEFRNLRVRVAPLSFLGTAGRVDALIGLDVLRKTNLSIDYEKRTVAFGAVPRLTTSMAFYGKLPVVLVGVVIDGEPVRLLLDTGSAEMILYKRSVQDRLKIKRYEQARGIAYMGGRATVDRVHLGEVKIGPGRWERQAACLLDVLPTAGQPAGLLGVRSLGVKRLSVDFESCVLSWE